jgi:hypothetical protein
LLPHERGASRGKSEEGKKKRGREVCCEISPTASVKVIRIVLMLCNLVLSIQVENRNEMIMRRFIPKVLFVRGQKRERERRRARERERGERKGRKRRDLD